MHTTGQDFQMAKIAFILLCHKDPDAIIQQAERLTAAGDFIAIHFDVRADASDYTRIREALKNNPGVAFARRRIKCGWGEWSLVQATLLAVQAAEAAFPRATHFYMLSGDCMAIKSASYARDFLDRRDVDYIESHDFFASTWIKTGMKEDRLIYRHFFNERTQKRMFYGALELQRKLGLTREVPADIQMMIGSQWWCLRRRTIEALLEFCNTRRDVVRFFRTTWIPDETFFQTLVRHLVPATEIDGRTLTFLIFSDYGMPVTFYNDHFDLLLSQDFLFARKISSDAAELKQRLGDLWASEQNEFRISNEGRELHRYLAGRGRVGRRVASRFWERESTLGRERELMIVICKKWHVAKRLIRRVADVSGLKAVAYLFDEEATQLPDLGGIGSSLEKRSRHRRALLRMLYDEHGTDRMIICLDPANHDLMQDFYADRCTVKTLEVDCVFDDEYLVGHARRVGLAGDAAPQATIEALVPTIRHDFAYENDKIRDENFPHYYRISQQSSVEENAVPLMGFLEIPEDKAREIAKTEHLFVD